MFVYSVKSSKIKVILLIALCILATTAFLLASGMNNTPSSKNGISLKAGDADERVAFLAQFGWEFTQDPIEVAEVIIPAEFDEVYEGYNEIQKKQSFDLSNYKGIRVKRWTYEIKNYPGYAQDCGVIRANVLVYQGLVIGGDICSVELNGFMHGFEMPETEKETTKEGTAAAAATTTMTSAQATTVTTTQATTTATTQAATAQENNKVAD